MVHACRRCGQMHDASTGCGFAARPGRRRAGADEDDALVGNIVAERYHIADVLGVGSTGTVFGVEHVTFARPAAMKVLRPRFATPELVSRVFHGEARAAWSVGHPCLCEVFDIGTLPDGAPFFVMERLEGETLAARIGRERLSLAAAVDVLMQLLSAIAAIHARDLLLRDLRPRNVYLVHRRGCRPLVKVLDFGLARMTPLDRLEERWHALAAGAATTNDGGARAIPSYLSPERARGEHHVEPASDLFVAATIFYEALAGQRPFVSQSWSGLLARISEGRPAPLHERRADVSPELGAFVGRCLSASSRERPSSAKAMQDELRAIVEGDRRTFGNERAELRSSAPARRSPSSIPPLRPFPTTTTPPGPPRNGKYERAPRAADERAPTGEVSAGVHADRTVDIAPPASAGALRGEEEEDETETTALSPELRARVDELMVGGPGPSRTARPPTKPPRRR